MHPTVIVGFDGSHGSEDALAFGNMLRRLLDYRLVVAACVVDPLYELGGLYVRALRKEANEALASAHTALEDDGDVTFRLLTARSEGQAIHDIAEELDADMIVVGATHHRAAAELFAASVTHKAIHAAPCAVAVPPAGFRVHPHLRLHELAVAFDDSPESLEALHRAADIALQTGARITVLHAFHPVLTAVPLAAFSYADPDYMAEVRSYAEERLARAVGIVRERAPEIEVRGSLLSGDAAERLIEATEHADLLFLGSRGYGPLRRALLGSVSGRVVRRALCPVIVTSRAASQRSHAAGAEATHEAVA